MVVENVLFHVVGIMATISVRWFETLGGYSHSTEAVLGRRRKTHLYSKYTSRRVVFQWLSGKKIQ